MKVFVLKNTSVTLSPYCCTDHTASTQTNTVLGNSYPQKIYIFLYIFGAASKELISLSTVVPFVKQTARSEFLESLLPGGWMLVWRSIHMLDSYVEGGAEAAILYAVGIWMGQVVTDQHLLRFQSYTMEVSVGLHASEGWRPRWAVNCLGISHQYLLYSTVNGEYT